MAYTETNSCGHCFMPVGKGKKIVYEGVAHTDSYFSLALIYWAISQLIEKNAQVHFGSQQSMLVFLFRFNCNNCTPFFSFNELFVIHGSFIHFLLMSTRHESWAICIRRSKDGETTHHLPVQDVAKRNSSPPIFQSIRHSSVYRPHGY